MTWLECVLIICGISFDVFAQMECQGSLVAKIKTSQVIRLCIAVILWQLIALLVGHTVANYICEWKDIAGSEMLLGELMAAVILVALGARQIFNAVKHDKFEERREEMLSVKKMVRLLGRVTFYTILAGIALAFAGAETLKLLVSVIIISIAAVIAGTFTGYRLGFEHKEKAYIAGAIILIVIGVELLLRALLFI